LFEESKMAWKTMAMALFVAAATPAMATQTPMVDGAPPAPENALYCLKMEPITGTRIGSVLCWTRQQWADNDVDLDKAWAEDGVEVIGG
jgi:hypothetical protein